MIKEGMKVAAWGSPNLWSQGGKFSLQIFKILPMGEGALNEAYEELKQQLAAEGLFAQERKRPLPDFITKIAVLTGRDSAAQSDFMKILQENRAGFAVDYYPVQVQGKYAEAEILNALKFADAGGYDCVVLIRGGGSLEDLITFNSEKVARQIFAMTTPVIVGVGHEKDESIADYVADIRASTPSQAAYYLIANNQNFIEKQLMKADFIRETLLSRVQIKKQQLFSKYRGMGNRLLLEISKYKNRMQKLQFLLLQFPSKITETKNKVLGLERILMSLNPINVLDRGYALITGPAGKVIMSSKQIKLGDII
jgi:exodeoxyribonuclease VII large subunit